MVASVFIGCSGPSAITSDAAPSDAPSFSCEPGGPAASVRAHAPGFNSTIVIHDADGAVVNTVETGSAAFVDLEVPACGAVTRIDSNRSLYETTTQIVSGELYTEFVSAGQRIDKSASVVIDSPFMSAPNYLASAGDFCSGQGASSIPLSYSNDCIASDGTGTVLVTPFGTTSDPFAYALFENVVLAATQQSPLRVTTWREDAPIHQFVIELTSPASSVGCGASSIVRDLTYRSGSALDTTSSGSSYALDIQFAEFGTGAAYSCTVSQAGNQRVHRARVPAPLASSVTLRDEQFLPQITNPAHDGDPSRPTISWSVEPNTVEEDLVLVAVGGSSPTGFAHWRLIGPPGTRSIRTPQLPADLAFVVSSTTSIGVHLFEASDFPGYREAAADTTRFYLATGRLPVGIVIRTTSNGDL
jgi:hypothetical protein